VGRQAGGQAGGQAGRQAGRQAGSGYGEEQRGWRATKLLGGQALRWLSAGASGAHLIKGTSRFRLPASHISRADSCPWRSGGNRANDRRPFCTVASTPSESFTSCRQQHHRRRRQKCNSRELVSLGAGASCS